MSTSRVPQSLEMAWQPREELYLPCSAEESIDWREAVLPGNFLIWLVGIWLGLYIVRPWEWLMPSLQEIKFERVYCLLVVAGAILSGKLRIAFSGITVGAGLLLASFAVSEWFGIPPKNLLPATYKYIVHLAMLVIVFSVARRKEHLAFFAVAYIAVMAAYLGKCNWEYWIHGRHQWSSGVCHMLGLDQTYRHYNGLASSAALTMPFWYLLWQRRADLAKCGVPRQLVSLCLLGYALLAFTTVLLTNSRSGMLGFAIFVVLAAMAGRGLAKLVPAAVIATVLLAVLWIFAVPEAQRQRLNTLWDPESGPSNAHASLDGRKESTMAGWHIFKQNPVLGVGPGNFQSYRAEHIGGYQVAHNVYTQTLAEHGALGGAALTIFILSILQLINRTAKRAQALYGKRDNFVLQYMYVLRNTLFLLLYFGLCSSNIFRFNWYWVGGLAMAAALIVPSDREGA